MNLEHSSVQETIDAHLQLVASICAVQDQLEHHFTLLIETEYLAPNHLRVLITHLHALLPPLTHFLEHFITILRDEAATEQFRLFLQSWSSSNPPKYSLLAPYFILRKLTRTLEEHTYTNSPLHLATRDLLYWYAYLCSSGTGQSSLATRYNTALGLLCDTTLSIPLPQFAPLLIAFFDEKVFEALEVTDKRAAFLLNTPDDLLHTGDLLWWCQQFDSLHNAALH